jgi:hypothetical protein
MYFLILHVMLTNITPQLQAPYNFGEAQIGVKLQKGKYLIIPSLYRRGTHGGFYLSVYTSSKATKLQNGVRITAEHEASHLSVVACHFTVSSTIFSSSYSCWY